MRIAYVCNEYPPVPHGGIGTFTRTIARGMTDAGHQVTVVGYGADPGERDDHGIKVVTLPECRIRGIAWLINRLRLHRWLRKRVDEGQFDVIETPEFAGLLPFPLRGCPVIVHLHLSGTAIQEQAGLQIKGTLKWCETNTLKHHSNWLAASGYILEATLKTFSLRPDRSTVIYYPIDVEDSHAPSDLHVPERFIMYGGTVSARKGAYVLAEACRDEILLKWHDMHLVYVGKEATDNGIQAHERIASIVGPELLNRVHFLGRVNHHAMLECMRKATVFAFPSRLESFGLVPFEAIACGTPVVYTKIPPGPEVIEDGVTGLLADPYNPRDVAEKIIRILDEPQFAEYLVNNGKKVISQRHNIEKCVASMLSFYQECAKSADM